MNIPIFGAGDFAGVQYPEDAASLNMVASGVADTFGAYGQLSASLPVAFVLCGVCCMSVTGAQANRTIQLAEGAAASEVVFEEFGMGLYFNDPTTDSSAVMTQAMRLAPRYIAAGTRLAARHASSLTTGSTRIFVYGFDAPTPAIGARILDYMQYAQGFATKGGARWPQVDYTTLAHSGSAWTDGAWVELIASAAEDLIVEGIEAKHITNNRDFGVTLGVGAAGSEVQLPGRIAIPGVGSFNPRWGAVIPTPVPLFVPKGARLAARQRATSTTGTTAVAVKVSYLR